MSKFPTVSIVILNWNGIADTLESLQSVYKQDYPNYVVIVVDNASTDNSVEKISLEYPNTKIIQNEKNFGYALGNNIGMQYASENGCEYFFLLNNDTVLEKDTLGKLIKDFLQFPNAAAIAPISFYYDQRHKAYFAGGRITKKGKTEHLQKSYDEVKLLEDPYLTDWLTGCALLIKKSAYEKVGGFDPRFFLLFEDADWSLRARKAGYDLMISPKSWLFHKVSASFQQTWSPEYVYYYVRNALLFYEKNFPLLKRIMFSYYQLTKVRRLIKDINRNYPNKAKILQQSLWNGFIDYFLRKFGNSYHKP